MRRLPIGIQDFAKLRKGSHVYVDKTEIIYQLVNGPQGVYFLSRPRRFGKSLLCSTLKAIFEGKKELFQEINELGIGPQGFGGSTTALAVHIETFPSHIAGMPVAVNLQCHAARHKEIIV